MTSFINRMTHFALASGIFVAGCAIDDRVVYYTEGGEFTCNNGSTIVGNLECNQQQDCIDGSDEHLDCEYVTSFENFTCDDGFKISSDYECDVDLDCPDGSDEHSFCVYLECSDGWLLPLNYFCDGVDDCGDESDEPLTCNLD